MSPGAASSFLLLLCALAGAAGVQRSSSQTLRGHLTLTRQHRVQGPGDPSIRVEQRPGLENTTIVVHVVNDNDGRAPAAPPRPPSMPAARLGMALPGTAPGCENNNLITCNAAQLAPTGGFGGSVGGASMMGSGASGMGGEFGPFAQMLMARGQPRPTSLAVSPAAQLSTAADLIAPQSPFGGMGGGPLNLQPAPLSVTTPAADLLPTAQVTPVTGSVTNEQIGTYSVQTVPGVRIVGEDKNPNGCQCDGDPCKCQFSMTDQIEAALDRIKTAIVEDAQKVQQENRWVRSVKKIIKHYEDKIDRVNTHVGQVKDEIKRLFAKKKHYEDLLLQHQLDEEHFRKAMKERKWEKDKLDQKKEEKYDKDCAKRREPRPFDC